MGGVGVWQCDQCEMTALGKMRISGAFFFALVLGEGATTAWEVLVDQLGDRWEERSARLLESLGVFFCNHPKDRRAL